MIWFGIMVLVGVGLWFFGFFGSVDWWEWLVLIGFDVIFGGIWLYVVSVGELILVWVLVEVLVVEFFLIVIINSLIGCVLVCKLGYDVVLVFLDVLQVVGWFLYCIEFLVLVMVENELWLNCVCMVDDLGVVQVVVGVCML